MHVDFLHCKLKHLVLCDVFNIVVAKSAELNVTRLHICLIVLEALVIANAIVFQEKVIFYLFLHLLLL